MINEKTLNAKDADVTASKQPMITMYRGGTTFQIGLRFNEKGKESLEDKIKKMIRRDVQNDDF